MRSSLFAIALFALGCGDSAGPTVQTAKPIEQRNEGVPVFPTAEAPTASDSAAAAIAAKILAAHTSNDPSVVEKVKTVRVVRDGVMQAGAGGAVKFEFIGDWEKSYKYSYGPAAGIGFSFLWTDGKASRYPDPTPLTEADTNTVHRDAFGEWLPLLVPFAHSKAVFGTGPETSVEGKKYPSLRFWMKSAPQVIVSYDPATYRVTKWTYNGLMASGVEAQIELLPMKYESFNGLLYPGTLAVRHAGVPMITFTQAVVEFPKAFDKNTFTLPKN